MVKNLPRVISVSEIDTITFSAYNKIRKCIMHGLPSAKIELDGTLDTKVYSVGLDLSPVTRSTLCEGFSYNLNLRRSQDERQTIYRRADHFDPERA